MAETMMQSVTPVSGFDFDPEPNLPATLINRAARDPHGIALSRQQNGEWIDVTAHAFLHQVEALAKGLIAAGVQPGQRVGIFGSTAYEWTLADYAIWFAGGVTVPFYDTSSRDQLAWMLEDAEVFCGFVQSEDHAQRIREAFADVEGLADREPTIWIWTEDGIAGLLRDGADISDEELKERTSYATQDDIATLIYTSGTTGRSKGCVLTHGNFVLTSQAVIHQAGEIIRPGARCLLFLPLAHVLARFIQVVTIQGDGTLAHEGDLKKLTDALGSFRPTFILGVPRVFEKVFNAALSKAEAGGKQKIFRAAEAVAVRYSQALDAGRVPLTLRAQHALFDKLVYSKLRKVMGGRVTHAISGGGPLGEHLGHFFRGVGLIVLEGYGLTETTAPVTVNIPAKSKIGTVGVPLPGCAVAIAPDGEVLAKGVCVFREYWKNPEATEKDFMDGWFATGDIGDLDDDGYLRITGRKKELIVTSSGKNVAPAPIEDALRRHMLIHQPVLIGDNRNFISALIFLDPEMLPTWLENHGLPKMDLEEASANPEVHAAIEKAVERVNRKVSKAESIRAFRIVPAELTEQNGYLSAKQSVKRHLIDQDFADVIDDIYASSNGQQS